MCEGFQRESDGQKQPELAGIPGRPTGDIERADGHKDNHGKFKGIGEDESRGRGVHKQEIEGEKQTWQKSSRESESRRLAEREQGDLTYYCQAGAERPELNRVYTRVGCKEIKF